MAKTVGPNEPIGKFIVTQGADFIEKYGKDIASAGLGLSFREADFRLHHGIDMRKPESARELNALVQAGNFLGILALKANNENDVAQKLAAIMTRQKITLKATMLTTEMDVPYDFVKSLLKGSWMVLLSKEFAHAGPPDLAAIMGQAAADVIATRITSIPLWTVPAPDKGAAGTFEVLEVPNVAYRTSSPNPARNRLDMYLPKDKKDFPVLVLVHGGAWIVGDNRSGGLYSSVGRFLASQGIGVVMPNYRLSPAVKHPEHIKDVARAVAWTHANIAKHGGDPGRLYLAGHSAGAHLVSLLTTDESFLRGEGMKAGDIKGVIAVSGIYRIPADVMHFTLGGSGPRAMLFEQMLPVRGDSEPSWKYQLPGLPAQINLFPPVFGDTQEACAQASPVTHVRKGLPPFLMLVAEHDMPLVPESSAEFHKALLAQAATSASSRCPSATTTH